MPGRSDDNLLMTPTKEATVTTPSDRQVVITRTFNAPRSVVFDAWTKPEHVTQWWDPSGKPLERCEIDLRAGGEFQFVNRGSEHVFGGIYREITPPERLTFTTHVGGLRAEVTGRLQFREHEDKTTVVITMECKSQADRDALLAMRIDAGTVRSLENLAAYVESR